MKRVNLTRAEIIEAIKRFAEHAPGDDLLLAYDTLGGFVDSYQKEPEEFFFVFVPD
jgi:hypothetical protein